MVEEEFILKNNKKLYCIYAIGLYFLIYLASIILNITTLTIILKPGASLLAYIFLKKLLILSEEQKRTKRTICLAFFLWLMADLLAGFWGVIVLHNNVDSNLIYCIGIGLYLIVRIYLLITIVLLYRNLTRKINRFRVIADIITIATCIATVLWLVFLKGKTESMTDGNIDLFKRGDIYAILSFTFLCISLIILSVLMITWFHVQKVALTLGQKLIMIAVAGIAFTDVLVALNNSYIEENIFVDISYKFFILLFALGAVFFQDDKLHLSFRKKDFHQDEAGTWKNAVYLFAYPVFTASMIGFNLTILLFLLYIAFYIVCCLYVKQITITDSLLETERKYNKQLKLYSNVLEQAPLSIVITDIDGNIEYVNPYFTEISGYTMKETIGKNPRILKSEKTPQSTYEVLWNNLVNGKKWEGEFININKEGQEYEEKAVILPIKNETFEITKYVAIKENVSEAKKIRNQLSNQNYFTSQLLDTLPNAIFYVSINDVFLGANAKFREIYGFEQDDLIGMKLVNTPFMNEIRYQHFTQKKKEALQNNAPSFEQIKRRSANGVFTNVLYSVSPFYLSDGQLGGYLGVMTDITELKQKEMELEVALKEANAATEAKSQFLANMSHEIRTPMNAIIGMSYLALKTELDNKQRDYVQKIHSAANSLLGIINDILDFSKIESGKMELEQVDFDLDTVVTNSIGLLVQKASEKKLEFLYHLPVGIPRSLVGDSLRLGQIITNLVSNAVKFTEHGEIEIDIKEEDRKENQICLKFLVRDTGIGILPNHLEKLFDAFTQSDSSTTRQYGGTGLGLSICKKLVEMMNGMIWVESECDKGSTFFFTAWFTIRKEEKLHEKLVESNVSGMKILIVDDNSAAREIMQEYLSTMGFQTKAVASGEDAIYTLLSSDKNQPYEAVFMDWQMPVQDGIQTIRKINDLELLDHKPFTILVTAYDMNEMVKIAEGLRVDSFLAKPVSQSTLYDTIVNLNKSGKGKKLSNVALEEEDYYLAGLHVLLAEDNVVNQQIARELLSGQGIHVTICDHGKDAVDKIVSRDETYDLILMDLQMPVMDGFEATKEIRKTHPAIPIIAMTARTMLEEKEKCYQIGMNDHIAKPIDPQSLFKTIRKWIKKERLHELQSSGPRNDTMPHNSDKLIIRGIDTYAGLKRVSNNIDLYKKLLRNFALNQIDTVGQIEEAIKNGNVDAVEKLSHMLRGVSGNIGAIATQRICEAIERNAVTVKDKSELLRLSDQLSQEMNRIVRSIHEHVPSEQPEESMEQHSESIEELVDQLCVLLDDGDSYAVDYFNSIKSGLKKYWKDKEFDAIEMMINNYEFEEAKECLKRQKSS